MPLVDTLMSASVLEVSHLGLTSLAEVSREILQEVAALKSEWE